MSGPVNVDLGSSLAFEGVQLLLGNDLAGDKVVVIPMVTDVPCVEQLPDPVERNSRFISCMCCNSCCEYVRRNHLIKIQMLTWQIPSSVTFSRKL